MTKEEAYQTIIKNLLKRENFRRLFEDLTEAYISEAEYEKAIDDNPEKYVIEIKNSFNEQTDLSIILEISNEINFGLFDLSVDDVAEMFSISTQLLNESLDKNV